MAKASMRPETKAAKLRNNKTSNKPFTCQTTKCENEAIIHTGKHDNRIKKCWTCHTNPPQDVRANKLLVQLRRVGLI